MQSNSAHIDIEKNSTFNVEVEYKKTELKNDQKFADVALFLIDLSKTNSESMEITIFSPNFAANVYPNSAYISWFVAGSNDYKLKITAKEINLESCCDSITAYDGPSIENDVLGVVTGTNKTVSYYSSSNTTLIVFRSDCTVNTGKFRLLVKAIPTHLIPTKPTVSPLTSTVNLQSTTFSYNDTSTPCEASCLNQVLFNNGNFYSPGYPGNYYNNLRCSWLISSRQLRNIKLNVYLYDLEYGYDYLYIYNGDFVNNRLASALTGSYRSYNFISDSYEMLLEFRTNSYGTRRGFFVSYSETGINSTTSETVTERNDLTTEDTDFTTDGYEPQNQTSSLGSSCEHQYLNGNGSFFSPNFPSYYSNNLNCNWTIFRYSKNIKLDITVYSIESCCDYIEIYESDSNNYPQRITGNDRNFKFVSNASYVTVNFKTDHSISGKGFRVDFSETYENPSGVVELETSTNAYLTSTIENDFTTTGSGTISELEVCGTNSPTIIQGSGSISSPNYPVSYYNNLMCSWLIKAPENFVVHVYVILVDTEFGYDFLELYHGNTISSKIVQLSGYYRYYHYYSNTNQMLVTFKTDSSNCGYPGFQLSYESVDFNTYKLEKKNQKFDGKNKPSTIKVDRKEKVNKIKKALNASEIN